MVIGRVALVTGSATGIGRWIVLKLATEGIDVAVNYRKSKSDALSLVKEVSKLGVQAKAYRADVSNPSQAKRLVASTVKDLGQLDILVNNAGDWSNRSVMETTDEEFDSIVKGNYYSAFYCTKAAIPHLRKNKNGRIVNIGIVGAQEAHGIGSMGPYMGAKAAVVAFTRSLALEEAKYGITANVVCPGRIQDKVMSIREAERSKDPKIPLGRPPTGEDIANAVLFLVSDQASFITGNVLLVTGGWHI
jgi:3-oxoacyl-[acyl-carrier protein] reductase